MEPPPRGGRLRRLLPIVIAVALPWLWFGVRDVGGAVDTVAVGLPLVGVAGVVVGAIVGLATRRAWPVLAGTSILVVCSIALVSPRLPRAIASPDPSAGLVVANVWDDNPTEAAVPGSLLAGDPDVVVAVEMSNDEFYERMSAQAAASGLTSTVDDGELGAWSRFPLRELGDVGLPPARVMRVGVDAPGMPFVLYVVHSLNPLRDTSFADQRLFTDELLAAVEQEGRPVVVVGDFNMSDRVVSYRAMDAALNDAMRADTAGRTTYVGGWWTTLLLRIDHVFVDPAWCAQDPGTITVPGSDHRGVRVAVGPCP